MFLFQLNIKISIGKILKLNVMFMNRNLKSNLYRIIIKMEVKFEIEEVFQKGFCVD